MENQLAWAQAACARILRPVIRLALAMGMKHPHLEEMVRDLLLDEAHRLWLAKGVKKPNISQLSVTTGLNRKAVTAKVRDTTGVLPATEMSAAAKTFTFWLQMVADDPTYRQLPIAGDAAITFESIARLGSRGNVHHRTILDELLRLRMVAENEGRVELKTDGFVPAEDLQSMLAFLGDNARDHLNAAVANTLGRQPPLLERAVYATGVTLEDCERINQLAKQRWGPLHHELTREMTRAVDRAGEQERGRVRVGIYAYYEGQDTDAPQLHPAKPDQGKS